MTVDDAIAETATLTRKFARRQVGWFGRNPCIRWFDVPSVNDEVFSFVENQIPKLRTR
jgi:tRNA A37 N6-isopentenylltransferase MiaA